jgi:FtsH-binding integral membrane protein
MRELGLDLLVDALVTAAAVAGSVGFTVVGVLVDRAGLEALLGGAVAQGVWELWMGTLAVFVGLYLLGYRTAWPALVGGR